MKRGMTIAAGLLGLFIGSGLILPAIRNIQVNGVLPSAAILPYTLGVALVLAGASALVFSALRKTA
jgi:hypothetical protein